jgi:hypothetical protein
MKKEAGRGRSEAKAQWGRRLVAGPSRRGQPKRGGVGEWAGRGPKPRRLGQKPEMVPSSKKIIFEFQLILEFGRTLENCSRRFRKKFDMGIFPKIFWAIQEF